MRGLIKKLLIINILAFISLLFSSRAVFAESELSISISSDSVHFNLFPGEFDTGSQTITAFTNDPSGYTIRLTTTGNSSALVDELDNSKTIPTFTLPNGTSSIPVDSIGDGYGYSVDNGANYLPIPEPLDAPVVLFKTLTSGSNDHTLTFGIKTPVSTQSGNYSNTFNIVIVANLLPCQADKICYAGNGDDGTGIMMDQPADSNSNIDLLASNFSRPGYGFAGWNTEPDGSGINYGPNQSITTGDISATGLQLYANWIQSSGNLQGWNGCNEMTAIRYDDVTGDLIVAQNSITALTDSRDQNTYTIVKFADNQCWMTENLRLDLNAENLEINTSNTNKPTADFVTAANNHPASSNSFCSYNNASCNDQIKFNTNNTKRGPTISYDTIGDSASWYSYGNYYNWYTATAGNGTYGLNTEGAAAGGDICPVNWRLPSGYGDLSDLAVLDISMGGDGKKRNTATAEGAASSKRWRTYPYNYILSGEYRNDTGYNRGTSSSYATLNAANANSTNNLWLKPDDNRVNSNNTMKNRGQTVRCLFNPSYHINGNIRYDANGGSGTMADENNVNFSTAVAANNAFTKAYYEFAGWNTKADGSGVVVAEGGAVAGAADKMGISEGQTLTLYATWRSLYSLVYDGNGALSGTMTNAKVNNLDLGQRALVSPNFSRTGYGFVGWSLDSDASTKLTNGQNVTIYGPNESITIDSNFFANADQDYQITLYAVWLPEDLNHTMQSFGTNECDALSLGDVIALRDSRDDNTYTVARLEDGNCWMTESLRLNPSTTTFTSSNTNSPTADFIAAAPNSVSSNTLCNDDNETCVDTIQFNANTLNRDLSPSHNNNSVDRSWYSYGVMYNWFTASAGNGTFDTSNTDVAGDICPAGWRLPTGGSNGEFVTLNNLANNGSTVTDAGLVKFPDNFIYSGDFNHDTPNGRNDYGRYWSATPDGDLNAYRLGIVSSNPTPAGSYKKWDAFAVRCIKEGSEVIPEIKEYVLDYDTGNYVTDIPDDEITTSQNNSYDFTLSTNVIPHVFGYQFLGYSTTSGDTAPDYAYDAATGTFTPNTITINSTGDSTTMTIYVVFQEDTCPADHICYFDNGASGGIGTMANQPAVSNSTATLIPSNYSKTGYGFAGWIESENAIPYGPNATINTEDLSSSGLKLYAKWIPSSGDLQTWSGCNTMTQGEMIALTDIRDSQTYAVAKLGDEKCWIVENLRLDPGTATMTSQNTNNPTAAFLDIVNESDVSLSSNTLCATRGPECIDQIQYNANNLRRDLTQTHNSDGNNVAWYGYGVYYNWYTATAGNGTFATTEQSGPNHDGILSGDICPANWHLPTGSSNGEYDVLNRVINNSSTTSDVVWRAYPNNFVWSGDYNNTIRNSSYSNGRMWTATTKDNDNAYRLGYATGVLQASSRAYEKWDGFAVRCVFNSTVAYNNVTVSLPQNVSKVTFYSSLYGTTTATRTDNVVGLAKGVTYTITATIASGYKLNNWTRGANGTIGDTSQNPTTFVITGDTTLGISVSQDSEYTGLEPPVSCNTPVPGITYMQDINSSNYTAILESLIDEEPYYLRDSRDNEPYCVSKLADGRLWMLDNLRLDLGNSDTLNNVNALNTNASATALQYLKNGGGTVSDQYPTAAINSEAWVDSGQDYYSVPMSVSSGTCLYSGSCVNESNSQWTKDSTVPVYGSGSGKVGVLYNYCAISAGTYCYGNGTSKTNIPETDSKPDSLYDLDGDICPAGWRMPTGNIAGDLYSLYNYYSYRDASSPNSLQYKTSIPFAGNFISGKLNSNPTFQGAIWTSTRDASSNPQEFLVRQNTIVMVNSLSHNHAMATRCLLNTPVDTTGGTALTTASNASLTTTNNTAPTDADDAALTNTDDTALTDAGDADQTDAGDTDPTDVDDAALTDTDDVASTNDDDVVSTNDDDVVSTNADEVTPKDVEEITLTDISEVILTDNDEAATKDTKEIEKHVGVGDR